MLKYFFSISWWRRFRASCKPIIRDGTLGFSELGVFFSNLSRDSTLASTKIGHCVKTDSGRTTLIPASLVPAVFFTICRDKATSRTMERCCAERLEMARSDNAMSQASSKDPEVDRRPGL